MCVSKSTVSRVLVRAGLSSLADLQPAEPVVRYEHEAPGDMLHIDTKKLGRIVRPSHRVTGNRRDSVSGADEKIPNAVQFLRNAHAYYASMGVQIKRLLTDNGAAFRSRDFAQACRDLGIRHRFTRPYRPQTNGKAERFIQSALREWAYGFTYQHSGERTAALGHWNHYYNWHRPHQGIGGATPMSRLNQSRNNLLKLHI